MPTQRKIEEVTLLSDRFQRSQLTIVADYRGLTVSDMQALRGQLRPLGSEMRVTKNTLATIAARESGREALEEALTGPTALIFVYDDISSTAKVISDFARTSRILEVRAGLLGDRLVNAEQVASLATLPKKEQIQAELVGALVGPASGVVSIFNSVAQSLVSILDQKAQQTEGAESVAESA